MATDSFKVKKSVKIESGGTASESGDLAVNSNKVDFHNGTTVSQLVTEAHSATFTNKSIDADTNTITNIENADIKAAAAIALDKLAPATASRALASDASGFVTASATTATELGYVSGVTSAIQTQLNAAALASDLTTHIADTTTHGTTGNVVGTSDAQVLTNKDIDGGTAANTRRITIPKDTFANITALTRKEGTLLYASDIATFFGDDGAALSTLGSGGGGSSDNLITDPNFDTGSASAYVAYKDLAGAWPVDATGGAPTLVVSINSSTPLFPDYDLTIIHDAADRQGEGGSTSISIPKALGGKLLTFSFYYAIEAGTYADGDLVVGAYDVTNSQLLYATPHAVPKLSGTTVGKFSCNLQTNVGASTVRLFWHVATSTAVTWEMRIDNIFFGPQVITYGAAVSDWTAFTPTGTWNTNVTYTGVWRRVGDSMNCKVYLTCSGAPNSATLSVNLPSGYSIDSTKVLSTASDWTLGFGTVQDSGVNDYNIPNIGYNTSTSVTVSVELSSGTYGSWQAITQAIPMTWGANDKFLIEFTVPIAGWGTSQSWSGVDSADGRVVAASYKTNAGQSIANNSFVVVLYEDLLFDTHGAYDVATGKYTFKVAGKYRLNAMVSYAGAAGWDTAEGVMVAVYKNGASLHILDYEAQSATHSNLVSVSGTALIDVIAGDYIEIRAYQNSGGARTLETDPSYNHFEIERLGGLSSITAGETVAASYTTSAAPSIPNGAYTKITYGTKVYDTHGSYSSGTFTANSVMKVLVNACIEFASGASWDVNEQAYLTVYKNGANHKFLQWYGAEVTHSQGIIMNGSAPVDCIPGDTLEIYVYQASGAARSLSADPKINYAAFTKVGV